MIVAQINLRHKRDVGSDPCVRPCMWREFIHATERVLIMRKKILFIFNFIFLFSISTTLFASTSKDYIIKSDAVTNNAYFSSYNNKKEFDITGQNIINNMTSDDYILKSGFISILKHILYSDKIYLLSPDDMHETSLATPTFRWSGPSGSVFTLEISEDTSFTFIKDQVVTMGSAAALINDLSDGVYYWRVKSEDYKSNIIYSDTDESGLDMC